MTPLKINSRPPLRKKLRRPGFGGFTEHNSRRAAEHLFDFFSSRGIVKGNLFELTDAQKLRHLEHQKLFAEQRGKYRTTSKAKIALFVTDGYPKPWKALTHQQQFRLAKHLVHYLETHWNDIHPFLKRKTGLRGSTIQMSDYLDIVEIECIVPTIKYLRKEMARTKNPRQMEALRAQLIRQKNALTVVEGLTTILLDREENGMALQSSE